MPEVDDAYEIVKESMTETGHRLSSYKKSCIWKNGLRNRKAKHEREHERRGWEKQKVEGDWANRWNKANRVWFVIERIDQSAKEKVVKTKGGAWIIVCKESEIPRETNDDREEEEGEKEKDGEHVSRRVCGIC